MRDIDANDPRAGGVEGGGYSACRSCRLIFGARTGYLNHMVFDHWWDAAWMMKLEHPDSQIS